MWDMGNKGDHHDHISELKLFMRGLKENAITNQSKLICKAILGILGQEKEVNPTKSWRGWEQGDTLQLAYSACTQSQYKKVIRRHQERNHPQ